MNLAISTILVLFLFIVPGLIFRRFYYSGDFSRQYIKEAPFHAILTSLIPGILIQTIFSFFINEWSACNYYIDYKDVFNLLLGAEKSQADSIISTTISKNIYAIALYNFLLWVTTALFAVLIKGVIRYFKLDRSMRIFRYQNEWHYIFRGEIYDYPRLRKRKPKDYKLFWTEVDVMVSGGGQQYMYRGVLDEYVLNGNNNSLDRIYISQVKKWIVDEKGQHIAESERDIPGDFFIVPFEQIRNINLTYITQFKPNHKALISEDFRKEFAGVINIIFPVFLWGHVLLFRISWLDDVHHWFWLKISIQLFIASFVEYVFDTINLKRVKKLTLDYTPKEIRTRRSGYLYLCILCAISIWLAYIV